jgi:hypothetical protein
VTDDILFDAIMAAAKLMSVEKRRDLIHDLLSIVPSLEEEFGTMSPPKFSTWIM